MTDGEEVSFCESIRCIRGSPSCSATVSDMSLEESIDDGKPELLRPLSIARMECFPDDPAIDIAHLKKVDEYLLPPLQCLVDVQVVQHTLVCTIHSPHELSAAFDNYRLIHIAWSVLSSSTNIFFESCRIVHG